MLQSAQNLYVALMHYVILTAFEDTITENTEDEHKSNYNTSQAGLHIPKIRTAVHTKITITKTRNLR